MDSYDISQLVADLKQLRATAHSEAEMLEGVRPLARRAALCKPAGWKTHVSDRCRAGLRRPPVARGTGSHPGRDGGQLAAGTRHTGPRSRHLGGHCRRRWAGEKRILRARRRSPKTGLRRVEKIAEKSSPTARCWPCRRAASTASSIPVTPSAFHCTFTASTSITPAARSSIRSGRRKTFLLKMAD